MQHLVRYPVITENLHVRRQYARDRPRPIQNSIDKTTDTQSSNDKPRPDFRPQATNTALFTFLDLRQFRNAAIFQHLPAGVRDQSMKVSVGDMSRRSNPLTTGRPGYQPTSSVSHMTPGLHNHPSLSSSSAPSSISDRVFLHSTNTKSSSAGLTGADQDAEELRGSPATAKSLDHVDTEANKAHMSRSPDISLTSLSAIPSHIFYDMFGAYGEQKSRRPNNPKRPSTIAFIASSSEDRRAHNHNTTDSGMVGSDLSAMATTGPYGLSPQTGPEPSLAIPPIDTLSQSQNLFSASRFPRHQTGTKDLLLPARHHRYQKRTSRSARQKLFASPNKSRCLDPLCRLSSCSDPVCGEPFCRLSSCIKPVGPDSRSHGSSNLESKLRYQPVSSSSSSSRDEQARYKRTRETTTITQNQQFSKSHTRLEVACTRKPFAEINNLNLRPRTAMPWPSSLVTAYEFDSGSSGPPSPDFALPSREEELRDRDAYYGDFTIDRQHKIDDLISRRQTVSSSNDENENQLVLEDSDSDELLVRKVEGAESSPSQVKFHLVPLLPSAQNTDRVQHQELSNNSFNKQRGWKGSVNNNNNTTRDFTLRSSFSHDSSSPDYPNSVSSEDLDDHRRPRSRTSSLSSASSASSKPSCTTHPLASSTLILESGSGSSENADFDFPWRGVESQTLSDLSDSLRQLEDSFTRQSVSHRKHLPSQRRPDRFHKVNTLQVTPIVLSAHPAINPEGRYAQRWDIQPAGRHAQRSDIQPAGRYAQRSDMPIPGAGSTNNSVSERGVLAGAHSFLRAFDHGPGRDHLSLDQEPYSSRSSNFISSPSVALNCAKTSIVCTSSESSGSQRVGLVNCESPSCENLRTEFLNCESPRTDGLMSDSSLTCLTFQDLLRSRHVSVSEPDLRSRWLDEADSSLTPSDTDTTPESLEFENRPEISGKSSSNSNSSGGSNGSCTAARCRPISVQKTPGGIFPEAASAWDVSFSLAPQRDDLASPCQDLLDSILTDSPKSVNSSGVFAPHNSYTSPLGSQDSATGQTSTNSSSASAGRQPVSSRSPALTTNAGTSHTFAGTSGASHNLAGKSQTGAETVQSQCGPFHVSAKTSKTTAMSSAPLPGVDTGNTLPHRKPAQFQNLPHPKTDQDAHFKLPLAPAPHLDRTQSLPRTRNQGVSAHASSPHRCWSVHSDPVRTTALTFPPSLVTGPPRIKNKNSLVRKLKRFSNNFYKKTEQIQTLANL